MNLKVNDVMKVLGSLPEVLNLAESGVQIVNKVIEDLRAIETNPNATQTDVDALIQDIQSRSDAIQKES